MSSSYEDIKRDIGSLIVMALCAVLFMLLAGVIGPVMPVLLAVQFQYGTMAAYSPNEIASYLTSHGFWGWVILLTLCAIIQANVAGLLFSWRGKHWPLLYYLFTIDALVFFLSILLLIFNPFVFFHFVNRCLSFLLVYLLPLPLLLAWLGVGALYIKAGRSIFYPLLHYCGVPMALLAYWILGKAFTVR